MIKTGKIWHSPLNVYWHIQELTKKVGSEAIKKQNKYQMVSYMD
jgi:5-methylcytosine-specific restriction endonuclease McrBC regulatory subunit McrC